MDISQITVWLALLAGLVLGFSILNIGHVSEFLYFQF